MAKSSPLSGRIGPRFGGRGARKRRKIIIASCFVIVAGSFATTLAANVAINAGAPLEFGQGQVPAIACDTSVTTAITEEWNNATAKFHVKTITLRGLNIASPASPTASNQGCGAKTLKVGLLQLDGTQLTLGSDESKQVSFIVPTLVGPAIDISPSNATVVIASDTSDYKATITFATPISENLLTDVRTKASDVYRVTLETD